MDNEKIKKVLENHRHWLNEDCDGWEKMKADLSNADLFNADLRCADLSNADLIGADLGNADLSGANLVNANLIGADLSNANLMEADLKCADLEGANLTSADLRSTNFSRACLNGANLTRADIRGAVFNYADLRGADFSKVFRYNIHYMSFCFADADLRGAKETPFIPYACPESGSFIGYKRAKDGIVELEIQADARRSSATGRKCRCDKAKVLGIYDDEHNLYSIEKTVSNHDPSFVYRVGEIVEEPNFGADRWDECAPGIHFFLSFEEAVVYG